MVDKKNYRTTAEIALIITLMISLGVNINNKDEGYLPFTCEKENIPDMLCYKLSRINDNGIQRNCYYNRDRSASYKVCSTGWQRLINVDNFETECAIDFVVLAYTDNGKYICDKIGPDANCVNDETLEMPFS